MDAGLVPIASAPTTITSRRCDSSGRLQREGYASVSLENLVRMRIHGVTPSFIRELKDLGYGGVKATKLVQFRIHGVDADFIRDAKAAGFKDLDEDDLVDLSIHGRRWMKKRG